MIFIATCFIFPRDYFIYTNFIFYLGIIVYFYILGDFKLEEIKDNVRMGKKFWLPVLWTAIGMIVAVMLSGLIGGLFPNVNDGMLGLTRDNWFQLIIFAISTIIFPPLAEELFFRKGFIRFDNKLILIITAIIGMTLYALEHSLAWLGILETMIVAVPLTISYIKTKNVYITMTAHFLINLIGNGFTVIFTIIKFMN